MIRQHKLDDRVTSAHRADDNRSQLLHDSGRADATGGLVPSEQRDEDVAADAIEGPDRHQPDIDHGLIDHMIRVCGHEHRANLGQQPVPNLYDPLTVEALGIPEDL